VLVGDASVAPDGGAGVTVNTTPTPSQVVTETTARLDFEGELVGRVGLEFDGDDRLEVKDSPSLALTGSSTSELRLRYDTAEQPTIVSLLEKADGKTTSPYSLLLDERSGSLTLFTADAKGPKLFTAESALSAGAWHDVAVVVDRAKGTVQIVVDGEVVLNGIGLEGDAAPVAAPLFVGASANPDAAGFRGRLDQLAIWSTARTVEEIAQDFALIDKPETADGLAGYWSFDEGDGDIAKDASPFGNVALLGDKAAGEDPAWFGDASAFSFSLVLTPEDTAGNATTQDLAEDLNRLLGRTNFGFIHAEVVDDRACRSRRPPRSRSTSRPPAWRRRRSPSRRTARSASRPRRSATRPTAAWSRPPSTRRPPTAAWRSCSSSRRPRRR
jgi:hypothetical protein